MKCLRCKTEMKHYPFNQNFKIYGKEHQENLFSPVHQKPHNPRSVYICDNCGYVEFSTNDCEESDI